jgi:hypothetical protein
MYNARSLFLPKLFPAFFLNSLRTEPEVFLRKIKKMNCPPKMVEINRKTNATILKSFPMNGHVSMF